MNEDTANNLDQENKHNGTEVKTTYRRNYTLNRCEQGTNDAPQRLPNRMQRVHEKGKHSIHDNDELQNVRHNVDEINQETDQRDLLATLLLYFTAKIHREAQTPQAYTQNGQRGV